MNVSRSDLVAFVGRYLAAWNDHDPGAMAELLAEGIVWEDPALPVPARGVAAVQRFMRAGWAAFPDLRFRRAGATPADRGRRAGRLALADARHDDRDAGAAPLCPDGALDGDRGRRYVDDVRPAKARATAPFTT
jgi:hypothetical protein